MYRIDHESMKYNLLPEPFPDLDSGLLLDHGNVLGPFLKRVDELCHDGSYVLLVLPTINFFDLDAILPTGHKVQNEGGGADAGDHLQNSSRIDFNIKFGPSLILRRYGGEEFTANELVTGRRYNSDSTYLKFACNGNFAIHFPPSNYSKLIVTNNLSELDS